MTPLDLHARVTVRAAVGRHVQHLPGTVRGRTFEGVPRYTIRLDDGSDLVDVPATDVTLRQAEDVAA